MSEETKVEIEKLQKEGETLIQKMGKAQSGSQAWLKLYSDYQKLLTKLRELREVPVEE